MKAVEWVWWRKKSMGVDVSENPCWMRSDIRRSWDKRPDWGRPGTVFKTSQKREEENFAVGVTQERY
jgi:hypothetical protein